MREKRPKIKIEKEPLDWLMEFFGIAAAVFMIVYPLYYYGSMPDQVPTHFGPNGLPDAYGSKENIWALPIIGGATYFILVVINRYPHTFNFPTKITEENAHAQYQIATRLIRSINTVMAGFFAYIVYGMVETALERKGGLGTYAIGLFLVIIFAMIG